jgi:Zn-dependent M16 (insulinase) family peptidase
MFADTDYNFVSAAIRTYIATDTTGFPPSIGKVNELIRTITNKEQLTPLEAVRLIKAAASNSLYNAKAEFDKLPPVLKKLVGNPSQLRAWAEMDADRLDSYVSNNIIKEYNAISKKEDIKNTIPENVRALMGDFSDKFRIEDTQNKQEGEHNEKR